MFILCAHFVCGRPIRYTCVVAKRAGKYHNEVRRQFDSCFLRVASEKLHGCAVK